MLTIYTKDHCQFCDRSKALLKLKNIAYEEIRVDLVAEAKSFLVAQGHRTVPQIYKDGKLFVEGGYTGLSRLDESVFSQLRNQ